MACARAPSVCPATGNFGEALVIQTLHKQDVKRHVCDTESGHVMRLQQRTALPMAA